MKRRVLLVEDDAASRETMLDWLMQEGFEVQAASDLISARAALLQAVPDVVLLDVGLGGQSGLDLAAWMRRKVPLVCTPVIAVTAHAMIAERELILRAGCSEYIPKPMDFKLLPAWIVG
ncbi:MAG: response regulator [Acidobacteria bacterium]|nr:response regulator [Acidobacteriota bacterium]MBI3484877.1 response regulator [Acidobacteriota bacterium]